MDKHFVLDALLKHNYFPAQRDQADEMPPVISSMSFSRDVAASIVSHNTKRAGKFSGYDSIRYQLTRFNDEPRVCSIPHPSAYSELALSIADHWDYLNHICENEVSLIKPAQYRDGRMIVMNYEARTDLVQRELENAFGKQVKVHADIQQFFPSIDPEVLPCVLNYASDPTTPNSESQIETSPILRAVRNARPGGELGLAIGPATSNVIAEVILSRVDRQLQQRFTYSRFNDDYTAYCDSQEEAEAFVDALSKELSTYRLQLNAEKTETQPLTHILSPDWLTDLRLALSKDQEVTASKAVDFLDLAVRMQKRSPDGSVLKYAIKSLTGQNLSINKRSPKSSTAVVVLSYALGLALTNPILVPLLEKLFDDAVAIQGEFTFSRQLKKLLDVYTGSTLSDATAWCLYYCWKYGISVEDQSARAIIATGDCIPILLLLKLSGSSAVPQIINFAESLDKNDLHQLDRYWLLLFQLFSDGDIASPYRDDAAFDIMRNQGVTFFGHTRWLESEAANHVHSGAPLGDNSHVASSEFSADSDRFGADSDWLEPVSIEARSGYRIWIQYNDGTSGEVDLSHLAGKGVFAAWNDRRFFESVRLAEGGGIAWGKDLELCPDDIYMRLTGKSVEELMPGAREQVDRA